MYGQRRVGYLTRVVQVPELALCVSATARES